MVDDRKAYVYVGKDVHGSLIEPTAYKIGSTYNIKQRQSSVYIGEVLFTIECDDRAAAFALEFKLHRYFDYRAVPNRNEWFYLTDDEVENIRDGFDGTVIVTDFMLIFAYNYLNRHRRDGLRQGLYPYQLERLAEAKRRWNHPVYTD